MTDTPQTAIELGEGYAAPDFNVQDDQGQAVQLTDFKGQKVVLFFYPKDDTPGCTKEACAFRDGLENITSRGTVVLGVSADSVDSHQQFKEKYGLNFRLLSDTNQTMVQAYGVWKEKERDGKKSMGIERTTFVLDEAGTITKIFPKVQVDQHYEEVLAAL